MSKYFFGVQDLEDTSIVNYFLRIVGNFLIFRHGALFLQTWILTNFTVRTWVSQFTVFPAS